MSAPERPPTNRIDATRAIDVVGGAGGGATPLPPSSTNHRSGFVALVGRPNVGKSTLLNRLLGQKLAIVSPKPQTTRNRITGIRTRPGFQVVYVDTPGLHEPRGRLGQYLAGAAAQALDGVDVVVLVEDARVGPGVLDDGSLAPLWSTPAPILLALNKVDRLPDKRELLPRLAAHARRGRFEELIPLSALHGTGVDRLEGAILARLPEGPAFYPAGTVTDQPETFFVAETVREKLFRLTHQEVPYASAVRVEELREGNGRLYIRIVIFVEQPSQKAIVIGAGGSHLKRIGQAAREELQAFFGVPVYLDLWVDVWRDWRRDPRALREFGYRLTS